MQRPPSAEDEQAGRNRGEQSAATGRFLLLCLRQGWDPAALGEAQALAEGGEVDWAALIDLATQERLAPLLYDCVRGGGLLPPAVEQELRGAYLDNAARGMFQYHGLEAILDALESAGVPVILLKGLALGQTVYSDPALRPLGDLDLLVRQAAVPASLRALESLGYRSARVETHPGSLLEHENELLLCKPGRVDLWVELHWSLLDSPHHQQRIPLDWFWDTAVPLTIGGAPAFAFGLEAQVIHLCAHLELHHGGEGLLWNHDIAEVLARYRDGIDWDLVLSMSRECDLVLPLQRVMPRLAERWSAPIQPDLLEGLRALRPSPHEVRVNAWLKDSSRSVGRRFLSDLVSTRGWRGRLRFAWSNIFPSPAYMRHRYGVSHPLLVPLYYPYRWFLGLRSLLRRP